MAQPVIEIRGVGKKYNIVRRKERYIALRDVIARFFKSPIKSIRGSLSREDFWALRDVNLNIQSGDVVGIIGSNGAGKSTLLKILSKITPPTEGEIVLRGRVASLLEVGTGFHPELSGRENIYLNGAILGMTKNEIENKFDDIVEFAGVGRFLDTPVKRYSSGMYVRLAFAIAAHLEPDILIVDEVLAVGDAEFQRKCLKKMDDVACAEGRTVLFVSHNMNSIKMLCNKCCLLQNGQITGMGQTEEVIKQYMSSFDSTQISTGLACREGKDSGFFINRVELRNNEGELTGKYAAGDYVHVHVHTSDSAPLDNYTVEFFLFNERGDRISFGAANPVRATYFRKNQTQHVCKLGPIPLTTGKYWFDFSVRVWGGERWDHWERAIIFEVEKCDIYSTGFSIPSQTGGDFVIHQEWHGDE